MHIKYSLISWQYHIYYQTTYQNKIVGGFKDSNPLIKLTKEHGLHYVRSNKYIDDRNPLGFAIHYLHIPPINGKKHFPYPTKFMTNE